MIIFLWKNCNSNFLKIILSNTIKIKTNKYVSTKTFFSSASKRGGENILIRLSVYCKTMHDDVQVALNAKYKSISKKMNKTFAFFDDLWNSQSLKNELGNLESK